MTNCIDLAKDWGHYIGLTNAKGVKLNKEMLGKWAETDGRLECVFCSTILDHDAAYCRVCHNYKGIQPYIREWSDNNDR